MTSEEMQQLLAKSFEDRVLSRGEKQAMRQVFEDMKPSDQNWSQIRNSVFEIARQQLTERDSQLVLDWMEDLLKLIQPRQTTADEILAPEAHFTPGDDCPQRIRQLILAAKNALDICVFTITDDNVSRAILETHSRGVAVRIITDNEKAFDPGSDISRFQDAGIPTKVDQTPFHMHHKFAIFDRQLLLTGSYNWTRGAARDNHENFVVTSEIRLVERFRDVFDRLWSEL